MRKYRVYAIVLLVILATGAALLYASARTSYSQPPLPGTAPLEDRDSAVTVARTVATFHAAEGKRAITPSLVNVEQIDLQKFEDLLLSSEVEVESSTLIDAASHSESAQDIRIWVVSFEGAFSPKRVPVGVVPPVYSKFEAYLDARDGSVIGIHMGD